MDRVLRWLRWPLRIFLLALAYVVTAHLSYLMADPGTYASAVFPPAGIALVAVLIWGWRISPGVFLGSVALNLTLGTEALTVDLSQLPVALGIAGGATLQALVGWQLCRRFAAIPVVGSNDWHEIRIVVLGGPLACVVSASIGNAMLVLGGREPLDAAVVNFWTWWVGDTIGVVIFTPLTLLAMQPRHYGREHRALLLGVLMAALIVVLAIFHYVSRQEALRMEAGFQQQAREQVEHLDARLSSYTEALHSLRRLWLASQSVEGDEFDRFAAGMLEDHPDIDALAWVPAYPEHMQVAFVTPEGGRLQVGMDLATDSALRAARDQAKVSGQVVIVPYSGSPLRRALGDSLIMMVPVYASPAVPTGRMDQAPQFLGVALGLFDLESGWMRYWPARKNAALPIELVEQGRALPYVGSMATLDKWPMTWKTDLGKGGRQWRVTITSPEGYRSRHRSLQPVLLLGAGLLLVGMLQALLLSMRRTMLLQMQAQKAERARELAEQTAQTKSSFLATMSHEIRTPMNGVIGMTQLLSDTRLSSDQQHYVSTIRQSCEALLRIINDILDYSKIEAGKLEVEQVPFRLPDLLNECASLFISASGENGVTLRVEAAPDLPAEVLGDPLRIRQILINLLANAFKFTREGAVVLRVWVLQATADSTLVHFEVHDTGIGMNAQQRDRLFEAFAQGDSSITRKYGGTGLGLSICRQLVELMHGTIGVNSEPGQGSVFWFRLPLRRAAVDFTLPPGARPRPVRDVSGLRVLVAEDNPVNQQVIAGLLKKHGVMPVMAADGVEALQRLTSSHAAFDMVFMDCEMPNMDGYTATERLRQWEAHQGVPPLFICGVSAHVLQEFRDRALQAGMNEFIAKPLRRDDLLRVLMDVAEQHRTNVPARQAEH